ncbi:hypothetical protein RvY_12367-2 [Ramazzottius varieornatus]|uniref:DH domain-containing protein n=1 Tax=Ramazzottius varieornatus TaxID=947166 RepID=A0A1D1VLJ5_RAMVA|nr:hypothetical protein RvY_12367-2 [Ramazzottius varieornatus]
MGQRRRLNSTGNDLSSDELQPPLNGKSSPSVMLEPQQMAVEHGDEGSRLQPTLPPQSLKRLSVPASYPQHTKSTGLGAAQSDSNLSPSSPSGGGSSSVLRRPISPSGFSRWRHVADKLLNKSGSTDSQGADYDSPAEDVSLSEPTSQTGAASAAGKADSVIHLLPMLRFDGDLRLELDEPEAWVSLVEPSVLGQLPEEEVKRQSMIHELIFLEKNYQIILLIIDQLYIAGLQRELQWSEADVRLFFPSFEGIVSVHKTFLGRLRARQAQGVVIVQIGDVFLQQFEGDEAEKMKRAYADFCCHKKQAEAEYKQRLKTDAKFAAFDKKWNENIGNRNLRFDSVMQTITQRITKYRILVDNIFKKTNKSSGDYGLMARACHYVDDVISHVNRELDQQKLKEELGRIYRSFDSKSTLVGRDGTPYGPAEEWKKHNLLDRRTLLFEARQVQIQRSSKEEEKKALSVTLLVMSDVLVLLSNSAGRDKYSWASIDSKRDRAVIHLQDLVLRLKPETAGAEERSLYLVSQELRTPYELTCETAKERDKLRKEIEAARDHGGNLRASSAMDGDDLADALFLDNYTAHIKRIDDVVAACRLRDDGIRRLCLEKEQLLQQMASCAGMTNYRLHRPPLLDMEEGNLQEGGEELLQSAQEAVRQADKLCCFLTAAALPSEGQGQRRDDGKEEVQRRIPSWPYGELLGQASPEPLPTVHLGVSAQAPARRHETFGGFDNKSEMPALTSTAGRSTSMKNPPRQRRSASPLNGTLSPACQPEQSEAQAVPLDQVSLAVSRTSLSPSTLSGRESGDGSSPSASSSPRLSAVLSDEQATLVPALIQLAHHLNQLTDGLAQHLTAVEALRHKYAAAQHKMAVMEGRDKRLNKHSGQLEELRALQEALARDKCQWQAQRDDERQQLDKLRKQLDADMMKAKQEREDVEKQRQAMFAQCEKLVENGLEVKLSSSAPYAQIFHRQQPPPEAAMSSELLLQSLAETGPLLEQDPRLAHLPPRPLSHQPAHYPPPLSTDGPPLQRLTSPPPLAAVLANGGPRSALAARSLLLPFNSFSSLPVAPALDTGATPPPSGLCGPAGRQPSQSSLLLPTGPPVLPKHSFSWKGSMESLCDKLRNPREGSALAPADRPDSAAPPRPTLRANSEAKLGIGNLMHLSEKDQALDHPPSTRKKGSAKKRYAF